MAIAITNPEVETYISEKYRPLTEELGKMRILGEENHVPIILRETEMLLTPLLLLRQPKKIVEIGTAIGYSAAYFAKLLPEAEIWTIEKDPETALFAEENLRDLQCLKQVSVLVGDGEEECRNLATCDIGEVDFLFIDAAKSHYYRFLEAALPLLSDGALICSDNILQHGMTATEAADPKHKHRTNIRAMREYVDFLFEDARFTTSLLSSGDGFAISIYHKNEQ